MKLQISLILSIFFGAVFLTSGEAMSDSVDVELKVSVPMPDGIALSASVYKPEEGKAPLPAIVTITPYMRDTYHSDGVFFAKNNFVFVAVDARGRGGSAGNFIPFENDAEDGAAVIEWVARQPWSNGQVVTWGASYSGYNQWAIAREQPNGLVGLAPVAAAYPGVDFPVRMGIPYPYSLRWLALVAGNTNNMQFFADESFWKRNIFRAYSGNLAFNALDQAAGLPSTIFQKWSENTGRNEYWDSTVPADRELTSLDLPVLTITGYYDVDQLGALEHYRRHNRLASEQARRKQFLVIGPWDHSGTRAPVKEFGGVSFGSNSLLDMQQLDIDWYNWVVGRGERPEFLEDNVAYFVAGANKWRYASCLDEIATTEKVFYLASDGKAEDLFGSRTLVEGVQSEHQQTGSYSYDPLDTSVGEKEVRKPLGDYLTNQEAVYERSGANLVYHTPAFDRDIEIAGQVKFEAWIEMNVKDTDILVAIYEVDTNGQAVLLTQDLVRARYRESDYRENLIVPGEINRFDFDSFSFFSRLIKKGHRLRLLVGPPDSINYQKNFNSGGIVGLETKASAQTAKVTLYHGGQYQSRLILPVVSVVEP